MEKKRCIWAGNTELMIAYHDTEWGVPVHDDRKWFEFIVLDGAQAGLSWEIVLKKREGYRKAFHGFDPARISKYNARDLARLLNDPGIVRNKLKINSTIKNAKCFLEVQKEFGSFDKFIWRFTSGKTIDNQFRERSQVPSRTVESDAMSKDLKKRGFTFVGTTICYSFMQAAGMVNDHTQDCFRYRQVGRRSKKTKS